MALAHSARIRVEGTDVDALRVIGGVFNNNNNNNSPRVLGFVGVAIE